MSFGWVGYNPTINRVIDNAARFTETGTISVIARRKASDDPALEFIVIDSGIGIPKDEQERIFETFRQVEGGIKRRVGGSGLGLAISRSIAELMGGTLSVESVPGHGSTFRLVIPLHEMPKKRVEKFS